MQLKKFRYPVLLTIISATLLLLSIPAGAAFGSEIDWLEPARQHCRAFPPDLL